MTAIPIWPPSCTSSTKVTRPPATAWLPPPNRRTAALWPPSHGQLRGNELSAGTQVHSTPSRPRTMSSGWSGNATGSGNPTSVTMDGDKAVTARFRDKDAPYLLDLPVVQREALT